MVELIIQSFPIPVVNCIVEVDQCGGDYYCDFNDLGGITLANGTKANPTITGTAARFFTDAVNGIIDPSVITPNIPYCFIVTLTDPISGCSALTRCDFTVF